MVYSIIIVAHVIAGLSALVLGTIAGVTKKGGKNHLLSGKWYVVAMYGVALSAFILSTLKSNPFLLSVGIFSLYLTYSGQRAIFYYRLKSRYALKWYDVAPVVIAFIAALFMVSIPIMDMIEAGRFFVSVVGVFGSIMLVFTIRDFFTMKNPENFNPRTKLWLIRHIGMISGAFIATFTAFLLTNVRIDPMWIVWLAPTVVGTIFITYSIRTWKQKLKMSR
jgi:uncharacterized membrane protein